MWIDKGINLVSLTILIFDQLMGKKVYENTNYSIYKGISFLAITQETIIYRLVLTNPGFGSYVPIFSGLKS